MDIFEEVRSRLDIKRVIEDEGIGINRNGFFICPFHNDTKPSASIKKDKQYFNCFVCGAGGDVINFTAKLYGLRNIDACKRLNEQYNLGIKTDKKLTALDRLKAKQEYAKRKQRQKEREETEKIIAYTGRILAEMHCYLWQGIHLYPYEDIRHKRGLANLPQIQYMLDCYDTNPKEYSLKNRKEVRYIDRALDRWDDKRK